MALTKAIAQVDEWQNVAALTGILEGATVDVSACYQASLHIAVAIVTAATVANGCEIRIQVSANTTGNEDWFDFTTFQGPIAAASASNTEAITNNPLTAGSTTITCASTTGYTIPTGTDNGYRYIKDTTIANSEVILQTSLTTNTNIVILDGTANEHIQTIPMWNIVGLYTVQIPDTANRVRIIYNNTKDATTGAAVDVMSRISKITAI
jgi:hypothetical protein